MKIFFSILLFLNLTGTYRIVAAVLGVPVSIISTIILAGLILWLVVNAKYVVWLLKNPIFNIACILILLWPMLTLSYTLNVSLNRVALQLYYFLLFAGTIIFLKRYGTSHFTKIIALSYWVAVAGLLLSFFFPEFFTSVAELTSATTDYSGRAFGFMLQPNMAVANLTLLFIFYLAFMNCNSKIVIYITTLSYLSCILLTGSRSGIVIMLMIFFINFFHFLSTHVVVRNKTIAFKHSLFLKLSALFIIVIFTASIVTVTIQFINANDLIQTQRIGFGLRERLNNFLHGKLSDTGITEDVNIQSRLYFQKMFYEKITERPFMGFGMGSRDVMKESGELLHSSHNQFLNYALEYGIGYCFLFFGFLYTVPLFLKKRRFVESFFRSNWILQMVLVVLTLSWVSNTVLTIRTSWPLMGAIFFYLYMFKINPSYNKLVSFR